MLKMNRNMGREHILEWYFAIDGVTNGPFDAEAMKQLFREGKIVDFMEYYDTAQVVAAAA